MKKITTAVLMLLIFYLNSNGQITKGNWLVGGNASFSSTKGERSGSDFNSNRIYLNVTPDIGLFVVDKLALGIKGLITHENTSFNSSGNTKSTYYGMGPFIRYYILPTHKQLNIFSEGSYQFYKSKPGNNSSNNFALIIGSVMYVNTIVGIEFTAGYSLIKNNESALNYKIFQLGLGLQIHLEKDKNQY